MDSGQAVDGQGENSGWTMIWTVNRQWYSTTVTPLSRQWMGSGSDSVGTVVWKAVVTVDGQWYGQWMDSGSDSVGTV